MLAGHASGCWLSALGAGVPYKRNKKGLRQCAKLHDFGEAVVIVVVVPGQ